MPHPLDTENMEQVITDSPQQFRDGLRAATAVPWTPPGPLLNICLAGMGGSWMAGALLRDASALRVPCTIHRSYGLPVSATLQTLVIVSSHSGNTEEALSAYDEAQQRGLPVVAIAAGGELLKRAKMDGTPFVHIPAQPPTMQPRSATGYSVGILAGFLARLGLAKKDLPQDLEDLASHLESSMESLRTHGEAIAPTLTQVTPIVYASDAHATVARIWKIKINENAKTPAFWNVFPELNHNEMIGWSKTPRSRLPAEASAKAGGEGGTERSVFHIILLRDAGDDPRILKRMDITAALLHEWGIAATIVPIDGGTRLEKMFSTPLVGDWLSYRLALELGVDPSPVAMVEDLKRRLKE